MSFEQCLAACERASRRARRAMVTGAAGGLSRRQLYKGAEVSRLTADWLASLAHPDDELRWNLRRLRARGRELARNNPVARQFLNMLAVNVVGPTGITLQSQVQNNDGKLNRAINDKIEAGWGEWGADPTVGGRVSLTSFEHQLLRTIATEGEAFVRLWLGFDNRFGFALEAIDADQVDEMWNRAAQADSNEIRMGVEVDGYGRPVAYHVWNKPESFFGSTYKPRVRERLEASQIIHIYDQERVNQTRGVLWFAPVMWSLKMLEGYSEAELVAARVSASKMGMFTRKAGETEVGTLEPEPGSTAITMEANPGTFDFVPDGYELSTWNPDHPSTAFADFMKTKYREVATGLGASYNALANDLEGVNYSSMRSGLLIERERWRTVQHWWIRSFLRRVYGEWLNMALLSGALVLDSRDAKKFQAARWTPRGWPWVDPLKDAQAGVIGIQTGLTSRRKLLAEQGLDLEEILQDLSEEAKLAEEYGVDISGPQPQPGPGAAAAGADEDGDGDAPPRRNGHETREELVRAIRKVRDHVLR